MGSDSFIFYRSFYEALQNVPKKHRTEVYEAVFEYVFGSSEPSLSGVPRALWELIRPQLDASQKRYENARKGAEYGKMGGRPKKKESNKKPLKGYENETLNVNVNENVNDNVNVNVCVEETSHTKTKTHTIPTLDDVIRVADQIGQQLTTEEAQRFIDYNAALGWKMEWQYALKRWLDRHVEKQKEQENRWGNDPDQRKEYGGEIDWGY